jgi:hypothetical protein
MSDPASAQDQAIAYYAQLIVLQYRQKPRAQATVEILVKQAIADMFSLALQTAFDLDTAVGAQLDILGKYIGVDRNSNTPASIDYFSYEGYTGGGSPNGYNDYTATTPNGFIYADYTGADLPTTAFTDIQYRFVLQLQIALNNFDGTLAYIQQFLADFFPGEIEVVDNLNMSITYNIQPGVTLPIPTSVLENFLPRPMGCGISINVISPGTTRITSDGSTRVTTDGSTRVTAIY